MTRARFLAITIVSISMATVVEFSYVSYLPPLSVLERIILSISIMSLVVLPFLYYLLFRPMKKRIDDAAATEKRLRALSLKDDITGLYSRQGFATIANVEIEEERRRKTKPVFIRSEVSNLHAIENTFGDEEGVRALVDMAHLLQATHRKSDIIARLGNSEFVVYPLGVADPEAAPGVITSRFQKNLAAHNMEPGRRYELAVHVGSLAMDTDRVLSVDDLFPETVRPGAASEDNGDTP